ncbi:MAG: hypothetical protein JOZ82_05135, partial [Marmoricola sp.]|nr:hypothetical protein [Marmoricola sp.]
MSSTSASTHEGRALRPRSALGGHVARIARELHTGDPQATVDAAVRIAARDVRGCDAAATSLLGRRGVLETPSYSDVLALRGELLQARLGEGPGLDS